MTTCARSSAETARGTFVCGDGVGVGAAIACGGGGVGFSDGTRDSSGTGLGLFSGFGVSLVPTGAFALPFAVFFGVGDAFFFFWFDFFFPARAFGVALGDFLGFAEAGVGSGVSLGFDFGTVSSSPDFFAAFAIGLGDFSGAGDVSVSFFDLLDTGFALAIGLGDFSGTGEKLCALWRFSTDCSLLPVSSSLTCARRTLPTIAPSANAVASQRRKRTTAAERSRAGRAIKLGARQVQFRAALFRVRVRGGESRLISPRQAAANRSNTSR
jgi:hypothetical protein